MSLKDFVGKCFIQHKSHANGTLYFGGKYDKPWVYSLSLAKDFKDEAQARRSFQKIQENKNHYTPVGGRMTIVSVVLEPVIATMAGLDG